jgi:hypothetical protein
LRNVQYELQLKVYQSPPIEFNMNPCGVCEALGFVSFVLSCQLWA